MPDQRDAMKHSRVDRDYPHQVELDAMACRTRRYDQMQAFCREGAFKFWTRRAPRRNDREYLLWCFVDPAHADAFQERFGGDRLTATREPEKNHRGFYERRVRRLKPAKWR